VLVPVLTPVGPSWVAFQLPASESSVDIAISGLITEAQPFRTIATGAVPGTLSADDRSVFFQRVQRNRCCRVIRFDIETRKSPHVRLTVPASVTAYVGIFGSSSAAVERREDRLTLHITKSGASCDVDVPADVYDMFWLGANTLLLYRADGLYLYGGCDEGSSGSLLVASDAFDVGAAVHVSNGVLSYATPAGQPSTILLLGP
jgi:hypothetical protein